MGGGASKPSKAEAMAMLTEDTGNKVWVEEKTYEAENSLVYASSPLFTELRTCLGEPLGQRFLGEFAKSEASHENFLGWIDMEEYKQIPTRDYRKCCAKSIFQKYIKNGAVMQLGGLTEERIKYYEEAIYGTNAVTEANNSNDGKIVARPSVAGTELKPDLFIGLQHMVFREMSENTYKRFKESELFKQYEEAKKKIYNTVDVDDFAYMRFLGQGAFGMVAHVHKKSTGKQYAMKVMSKAKLVNLMAGRGPFSKRKEQITIERNVYVNSHFPFIVEMHYAFQTEADAMIVMEFVRGGTLEEVMFCYQDQRMPEEHAKFVFAELMLALRHMHCSNYIHRDLKPINVLITLDGHVKLADMGLVGKIDETKSPIRRLESIAVLGTSSGKGNESEGENDESGSDHEDQSSTTQALEGNNEGGTGDAPAGDGAAEVENKEEDDDDNGDGGDEKAGESKDGESYTPAANTAAFRGRRYSRVGTMGYKAPELLKARRPKHRSSSAAPLDPNEPEMTRSGNLPSGYGASVDWWSLGVLLSQMLIGKNIYMPRTSQLVGAAKPDKVEINIVESITTPSEKLPNNGKDFSPECKSMLDGLLKLDPNERLGSNADGWAGLRNHPWLQDIDLGKLLNLEIKSPLLVPGSGPDESHKALPQWKSFSTMKAEVGNVDMNALMGESKTLELKPRQQRYFDDWDYVAPVTFKLELERQRERHSMATKHADEPA